MWLFGTMPSSTSCAASLQDNMMRSTSAWIPSCRAIHGNLWLNVQFIYFFWHDVKSKLHGTIDPLNQMNHIIWFRSITQHQYHKTDMLYALPEVTHNQTMNSLSLSRSLQLFRTNGRHDKCMVSRCFAFIMIYKYENARMFFELCSILCDGGDSGGGDSNHFIQYEIHTLQSIPFKTSNCRTANI